MTDQDLRVKTLRAERVVLVGEDGEVQAELEAGRYGARLTLNDAFGRRRLTLTADRDSPSVLLYDADGKKRVAIALEAGGPRVSVLDGDERVIAELS